MPVVRIHGPIISCGDIAATRRLFEQGFGLAAVAEQSLDAAEIATLWGLTGHRAKTIVLETPGTPFGVRLVQFDPLSSVTIRDPATGFDADALKVIDFYAPDFEAAHAHLKAQGFALKHDIAEYDLAEGHFIEGHLWGPDDVVCALIGGPADFLHGFTTIHNRRFSEVMSLSAPVSDPEAVLRFYTDVFGLEIVHSYEIDADSFAKLVGTKHKMHLRANNLGLRRSEPYFGIIHYGLPDGAFRSLRDHAVFPHRGLVGATVQVDDIDAIARKAATFGADILAPVAQVTFAPHGRVTSLTLRAPHGVIHHVIGV